MTNTTKVLFDNGTWRALPVNLADLVVGLDADGDLLVSFFDSFAPLTRCCNASGKGADAPPSYVVCRACYRPVASKYGTTVPLTVAVVG